MRAPEAILEARLDYALILPWNLREEFSRQMAAIREWGGRFVAPIRGWKFLNKPAEADPNVHGLCRRPHLQPPRLAGRVPAGHRGSDPSLRSHHRRR
ncbi:Rossmann-fold NAD(P)-binding domain-containing protein [Belnapia moabensis]|uniref:hypothetical protein n=1 Tax=Belnapia moabensis TaxID=365533 RepID=UPI0012EDC724|nr:hypothetical protein [Belnapia moabensis]